MHQSARQPDTPVALLSYCGAQASCGAAADKDPVGTWGCFTFHAQPAPDAAVFEKHTRLLCPTTHPVAPPPSPAPRLPPGQPPPPSSQPGRPPPPPPATLPPSPQLPQPQQRMRQQPSQMLVLDEGIDAEQQSLRQQALQQLTLTRQGLPTGAVPGIPPCPLDPGYYMGAAACKAWAVAWTDPTTSAVGLALVAVLIFLMLSPSSSPQGQERNRGEFHDLRRRASRKRPKQLSTSTKQPRDSRRTRHDLAHFSDYDDDDDDYDERC